MRQLTAFAVVAAFALSGWLYAQSPTEPSEFSAAAAFSYQGSLSFDGVPANGTFEFVFIIEDQSGRALQDEVPIKLVVTDGHFATEIPFDVSVFDGEARYLRVAVREQGSSDPYTVLSPSSRINEVPVAAFALTGNQGPEGPIGDTGPQGPQGEPGAPGTTSWTGLTDIPPGFADGIDDSFAYSIGQGLQLSGTSLLLASDAASFSRVSGGLATATSSRLGIGTASPVSLLDLRSQPSQDTLRVYQGSLLRLHINGSGGIGLGNVGGTIPAGKVALFGDIGINTASPNADFHVNGTSRFSNQTVIDAPSINPALAVLGGASVGSDTYQASTTSPNSLSVTGYAVIDGDFVTDGNEVRPALEVKGQFKAGPTTLSTLRVENTSEFFPVLIEGDLAALGEITTSNGIRDFSRNRSIARIQEAIEWSPHQNASLVDALNAQQLVGGQPVTRVSGYHQLDIPDFAIIESFGAFVYHVDTTGLPTYISLYRRRFGGSPELMGIAQTDPVTPTGNTIIETSDIGDGTIGDAQVLNGLYSYYMIFYGYDSGYLTQSRIVFTPGTLITPD